VFYGELFGVTSSGKRVQDLTYGKNDLQLRIFDIWHAKEQRWLTWEERGYNVQAALAQLGLIYVPPLIKIGDDGNFHMDEVKLLAESDSVYGGIREGVVIEALNGTRRKAKWVSERYHLRTA
jgi:ATP-dependent RNA circularization protein (DNA/RNA ligase family)